jgi:hypothetical protein
MAIVRANEARPGELTMETKEIQTRAESRGSFPFRSTAPLPPGEPVINSTRDNGGPTADWPFPNPVR